MKHLFFALFFALTTSLFAQTTLDEFNYANGGYLQLEKLGADPKSGYSIVKDESHRNYWGKWTGTYEVYKLIRVQDSSLSAVIFYNKTMGEVYCTVVEPRSDLEVLQLSLSKQKIFSGWVSAQPSLFLDMVQQAYWKDQIDQITDNVLQNEERGSFED
jgi:hypothetical protein